MNQTLEQLKALQRKQNEIIRKKGERDRFFAGVREQEEKIASKELHLVRLSAQYKQAKLEATEAERGIKEMEERIEKLRTQSNTVKTSQEYTAIQSEIKNFYSDKEREEEEALGKMEKADTMTKEVEGLKEEVKSLTEKRDEMREAKSREASGVVEELERLQAELQELKRSVDPEALEVYERVLAGREGVAVTTAVGGVCQECYMTLTPNTVNRLMGGNEVVQCPACQRILYLEQESKQPAE